MRRNANTNACVRVQLGCRALDASYTHHIKSISQPKLYNQNRILLNSFARSKACHKYRVIAIIVLPIQRDPLLAFIVPGSPLIGRVRRGMKAHVKLVGVYLNTRLSR